jgi:hypothetical protein
MSIFSGTYPAPYVNNGVGIWTNKTREVIPTNPKKAETNPVFQ